MSGSVYEYWRSQPAVLSAMWSGRADGVMPFVDMCLRTRPDRIYVLGSGTSFNAAAAAGPLMSRVLGVEVGVHPPSFDLTVRGERPVVVLLSQEGSSSNTLAALERFSGHECFAVVGELGTELANRCGSHMLIGCGRETAGPKTVGYTASVFSLQLAALEAARALGSLTQSAYDRESATIEAALTAMPGNLAAVEQWFDANAETLVGLRKLAVVGRGVAGAVTREAALKIMETMRIPVLGCDFEEYLHGPMLMTDPELGGMFLMPQEGADAARMATLADWHARTSRHTFRIGSVRAQRSSADLGLALTGAEDTSPFEYVLPAQLIAARLPELAGIPDGKATFEEFSKLLSTKHEG